MKRFFMIGNTHFDPVWLWKWGEGDLLLVYGVTNHGGAPTKAMLRQIQEEDCAQFSTVSSYFEVHKNCGYTVSGELLTGDFGPYSNHPGIKKQ